MTLAYTVKLDFRVWLINIEAQKIDSPIFKIFGIVPANFQVKNKLGKALLFQKTILLAITYINVILKIPLLSISNTDILFAVGEHILRAYIAAETLSTTRQVEIIDKIKFAETALNENSKSLVMHIAALESLEITIYPS